MYCMLSMLISRFCTFPQLAMRFLATLLTAMISIPYMIIVVVALMAVFVGLRWYYIKTARDVKRLEALGQH